jgi:2,3-bisphosphoglycerate-dependent phosphoglycerate mutase
MAKLILVRHGQSIWNLQNRFTGWVDVNLSKKGIKEAKQAGKLLQDFKFDLAYTSDLQRANETLNLILNENPNHIDFIIHHNDKSYDEFTLRKEDKKTLAVIKNAKLNERHYGALQGLNKAETIKEFGEEQVQIWRRSYDVAPPQGESLKDTYNRAVPYFKSKIFKKVVEENKTIIVSAHGNSIRAIIKYLEKISNKDIPNLELTTGEPIVYTINKKGMISKKEILK